MLDLSNEEWKKKLSPEAFYVLREKGTEAPFSGKYNHYHEKGTYACGACGMSLFSSDNKFDSGTGWPSYTKPISPKVISYKEDHSLGTTRLEILCANCGSHLGHVFEDGPFPEGKRYCINSIALQFIK